MNKVVIIYGPTAVGKSAVAVELAKKINAEIISADSMQIYKDLDIGTAKITKEEMQGINHHLINIKSCKDNYSVFDFCNDCKTSIADIEKRNKNVIIVGGTGLYIKALTQNYNLGNIFVDEKSRNDLEQKSCDELNKILSNLGKKVIDNSTKNNKRRLIREIEILKSGKQKQHDIFDNKYIIFGLIDDRKNIYDRINNRVDKMVNNGLLKETEYLLNNGVNEESQCMKAIGYKEIVPYIKHEKTLKECLELLKQKSRNYAKRQLTFMNQFPNIIKINLTNIISSTNEIYEILKGQN